MPTMPETPNNYKDMDTADILNGIRNDAGSEYQAKIPMALKVGDTLPTGAVATSSEVVMRLREIGNIMYQYQPLANAFLSTLVNRIAFTTITSRMYQNPWAPFKRGFIEMGETVQEIFVKIARGYQYDPETQHNTLMQRYKPSVESAFHAMNFQKFYPTTTTNIELRQAFLSMSGMGDLITRIIEQVYSGANYDEFLVMKYLVARMALDGSIFSVKTPVVTATNARAVTTAMSQVALKFPYMSKKWNTAGVDNFTNLSDLYFILTTDIQAIFNVEVLALSFNMDKAELIGRQVSVDGFGEFDMERLTELFEDDPYTDFTGFTEDEIAQLGTIDGLLIGRNFFMVFDNLAKMDEFYNPKTMEWTYFYHVWKTISASPFENAALFTSSDIAIESVTIAPKTASAGKNTILPFSVVVVSSGFADKSVEWTLEGSTVSTISQDGKLTVSGAETAETLTVKVTSKYDKTKSDTATVTIV